MRTPGVSALHAHDPGITEDLLTPSADDRGRNVYRWLAELLPAAGDVIDLCCGSAPLADHVGAERYLGVDASETELATAATRRPWARTVHADAATVDFAPGTFEAGTFEAGRFEAGTFEAGRFEAVALSMALMLLPLEPLLDRAGRGLGPGGALVATVPLRRRELAGTPYNGLLSALGWRGEPFPEPLDALGRRARQHGFAVVSDEVRFFAVPIGTEPDRELLLRSFYLTGRGDAAATARALLLAEVTAGRAAIGYPIRRVHLRRSG